MLHTSTVEPITLGLLKDLMQRTYLQSFVLVGGTALALQRGNRFSIDLDLFSNEIFEPVELRNLLEDDYPTLMVDLMRTSTLITKIQDIKVDFIRYKYGFKYPFINVDGMRLADIRDIAPMKLDAITGRGRKKDFFDLFFLLKEFTIPQLLELYQEKYQHSTLFHVIKSINYFDEAERDNEPVVFDKKVTWTKVKNAIKDEIRKL